MSKLYATRLIFPLHHSIGRFFGRLICWLIPNPWFDDNLVVAWELDNVNRSPAMFDYLSSWDRIAYTPVSMEEARNIELGTKTIPTIYELDKQFAEIEKEDQRIREEEEAASMSKGIHRAKAEPGYGQKNGWETIANEIYPGSQFRSGPLKDAKYPSNASQPGLGTN